MIFNHFIILFLIFLLFLLTVLNSSVQISPQKTLNYEPTEKFEENHQTKPICNFSDPQSDICNMTGDVRTQGNISTIFFVPALNKIIQQEEEWNFSPQSRRIMITKNVTVKQLHDQKIAPKCTVKTNIPAFVFSFGGPTGNIWHDFTEILIPLFLASKPLNREVQFVIRDYQQWFVDKYKLILKDLSEHEIINFDEDKEIRCFGHLQVGLLNHRVFGIDPNRAFDQFDLFKFRLYIRTLFSLPLGVDIPYKKHPKPGRKPRLMLVLRTGIRKFLNENEVINMIKKSGFELVMVEPKRTDNVTEFSKLVDSCDTLMGIHGAALTNILFLRTNAIMIQIIPYGKMDNFAYLYYGKQAKEMRLRELHYSINPDESSLLEKYGWDHPVIKDPDSIYAKGWRERRKYYWEEQNIRLNATRFEPVLIRALEMIMKE